VVAQKAADEIQMALHSPAFAAEYGLTLDELTGRFDADSVTRATQQARQAEQIAAQAEQIAAQAEQIAAQAEQIAAQAEQIADQSEDLRTLTVQVIDHKDRLAGQIKKTAEISNTLQRLRSLFEGELVFKNKVIEAQNVEIAHLRNSVAEVETLKRELIAVYHSTSWQVTRPLRSVSRAVSWFGRGIWAWGTLKPGSRPHRAAKQVLRLLPVLRDRPAERTSSLVAGAQAQVPVEARAAEPPTDPPAAQHGLIPSWQLDSSAEPDGARRIYRRIVQARRSSRANH
jgi:archaellum component FlaC